jgi:polysaccharide biosynthesis/export protein
MAWTIFPLLLLLVTCLTGCQSPQSSSPPRYLDVTTTSNTPASTAVRLHEGDVIRVDFEADTNMNTVAKIQIEGNINLPLAGDVRAAGKTLEELKADLMSRYERLLKVNEITVELVASAASITVSGAVLRPGRMPMERPLTVMEAVMEAGGFDPNRAKLDKVTVYRIESGQQQRHVLNLKRALGKGDTSPFYLKPFDIIHVPEKRFNL